MHAQRRELLAPRRPGQHRNERDARRASPLPHRPGDHRRRARDPFRRRVARAPRVARRARASLRARRRDQSRRRRVTRPRRARARPSMWLRFLVEQIAVASPAARQDSTASIARSRKRVFATITSAARSRNASKKARTTSGSSTPCRIRSATSSVSPIVRRTRCARRSGGRRARSHTQNTRPRRWTSRRA